MQHTLPVDIVGERSGLRSQCIMSLVFIFIEMVHNSTVLGSLLLLPQRNYGVDLGSLQTIQCGFPSYES